MTIPTEIPETRRRSWPTKGFVCIAFVMIVFGLLLQMRSLSFQKVIDDNDLIHNEYQRGCGPNPLDCFRHPVFVLYYRPLFTATFALGDRLHDKAAVWYHSENLALHAAVCGLAFWFFHLIFKRERAALLAGLVFVLHPLQVTVTTFIGGRPDSMALLFLLLFSIGAWNAVPPSEGDPARRRIRYGWLCLSILGYAAAVFTKEQCLSMLVVLPLLLWRPGFALPRRNMPLLALYLVPAIAYIVAAKLVIPRGSVIDPHWSTQLHAEMIGRTLFYFERLLVVPTVGPIHQSTLGPWDIPQPATAVTGFLVAVLWLGMLWRLRRHTALRFCALWTTLTLFPCLNLIPIPSQFASCYRAVIPLLGFAGLFGSGMDAALIWWEARLKRIRYATYQTVPEEAPLTWWLPYAGLRQYGLPLALLMLVIGYYSWETVADVSAWRNNRTLMWAEINGDPNFVPAYGGLGFWAEMEGDWKQVEFHFTTVLSRVLPVVRPGQSFAAAVDSAECQRNLWSQAGLRYHPRPYLLTLLPHRGWSRQQQGHFAAAAEDYKLVLLLNPNDDNSRSNLRDCYMANGQVEEAYSLYRSASEVRPRSTNQFEGLSAPTR
jgi:hypothetical protein